MREGPGMDYSIVFFHFRREINGKRNRKYNFSDRVAFNQFDQYLAHLNTIKNRSPHRIHHQNGIVFICLHGPLAVATRHSIRFQLFLFCSKKSIPTHPAELIIINDSFKDKKYSTLLNNDR